MIEEDGVTQVLPSDTEWFFAVNDNTTDSADLMYSFNPDFDMSLDTFTFNCDSVIIKSHFLDIFAKDKGGMVGTCRVSYVTTDPNDVCPDTSAPIQGIVTTDALLEVPDVKMDLVNGGTYEMTDQNGFYAFPEMTGDQVYELRPEKDTDHMAGVTSLDLVLIQRHILGIKTLSSPYQVIAADINRSGNITGKDLLDLRKNILGIMDGFPNNTSWRFADSDYSFIDPSNPFNESFPESYMIYDIADGVYKNFIGMKIGDVNASIEMNGKSLATVRSTPSGLAIADRLVSIDELANVPITLSEETVVAGGQISIQVDKSIDILDVNSSLVNIDPSMYRIYEDGDFNILTLVLLPQSDVAVEGGSVMLDLVLQANESTLLSEAIALNTNFKNELYTGDLEAKELRLEFRDLENDLRSDDILLQNTPNPWKDKTVIAFVLDREQKATINVYSVTGALLETLSGDYPAGRNEVELKAANLDHSGVLYYELVTDDARISKRMILVK